MAFTFYSLLEASLLILNAIAVLHEERFLAKGMLSGGLSLCWSLVIFISLKYCCLSAASSRNIFPVICRFQMVAFFLKIFAVSTIVISALFLRMPLCYRRKAEVRSCFMISEPHPLICFGNFPQINTKFCTHLKDKGNFKLTFQFMLQHFAHL